MFRRSMEPLFGKKLHMWDLVHPLIRYLVLCNPLCFSEPDLRLSQSGKHATRRSIKKPSCVEYLCYIWQHPICQAVTRS